MKKFLLIADLLQRAYSRWVLQRLLPSILFIAGLVIITSILVSALCISGAYVAYFALLNAGLTSNAAALIITASALFTLIILAFSVLAYLRYFRQLPHTIIQHAPITSTATAVLHAFLNGLLAEQTPK